MAQLLEVYKCNSCGNIVETVHAGGGTLSCCGEDMALLTENTVDAAKEKHIPVIAKVDGGYKVTVGSVAHPMEEKHSIEWIELIADGKVFVKTSKRLHVFALGKELKPLAEINIGSPSSPIAANGTLFVSSARSLYAVQKGAKLASPPADPEPSKDKPSKR